MVREHVGGRVREHVIRVEDLILQPRLHHLCKPRLSLIAHSATLHRSREARSLVRLLRGNRWRLQDKPALDLLWPRGSCTVRKGCPTHAPSFPRAPCFTG